MTEADTSRTAYTTTMSRLIFQNLPPNITTDVFKSKLTEPKTLQSVVVTDTKVVAKRRFAFVGFRTEEEAAKVKEWFNGSFVFGGGKVKVEFVSEEPLAPKAKRQKTDKHDKKTQDEPKEEAGPSKQYKEFMEVMKGDDNVTAESSAAAQAKASKKGKEKATPEPEEQPPADDDDDDDSAWLAKRKAALDGDDEIESAEPKVDPEDAMILNTGRLFVRNLAFVATADDIRSHFEKYGPIVDVHMPVSHSTGEPLGTAFVLFRDPNDALSARKALDKTTFQGRLLHVLPGRARPGQENASGVAGIIDGKVLGKATEARGEVKQRQDEKRKADSARGVNWATLYMNADAVAASVAKRMGVSKSELLDGSDDMSPAVKLALAETQVIAETKAYFENEGIVLDSLQPRVPRSQTTILVKNIPFGTTITQLQDLFAPHGELKRVLLPPAGTIGVVEFVNNMDAGRAFKALAYRRLGNSVLYLEKGPVGMFKDPNAVSTPAAKAAEERAKLAEKVAAAEATLRDKPHESDEAGATLFLKNLAFSTTNESLASVLSSLPGYSFSRVQTKPDPKRPGARLSMGYGFVGFKTKKEAQAALAGLEGFKIDGHAIEAKFAQRGQDDVEKENKTKSEEGKTKGTKLLVKNLPFEATKKDVRALFSAYGTLKSLRVPRKSTMSSTGAQSTRGFAFLEFTTHAEAQRAMDALKHTHLLGRHLVTEWAKDEDSVDVDALREKVSRDSKKGELGGRKRKLDLTGRGGIDENDGLDL